MKRTVFAFVLVVLFGAGVSSARKNRQPDVIVSETTGAVTFKVEDVKISKNLLPVVTGDQLGRQWLDGDSYLAASFADAKLVDGGDNAFFSMVCLAYAHHRPIVLTPDAMWILICHGFSQFVNHDPDKYRDYLVNHQGKETLLIRTTPETTTAEKVEKFATLIGKETNGELAEVMTCNFSTSGMIERMVSQIVLMDAVKPYFDYLEELMGCGIPSVTLEGTPDDWKLLREKTQKLGEYGVKEWTDKLDPILAEFVAASEGMPNADFWWDMAIKGRPKDFHLMPGGGCFQSEGPTQFDGWFLEFMPFDFYGVRPEKMTYDHDLLPLMTSVPIIQYVANEAGNCIDMNTLELSAGIVGLSQDKETKTLRPEIGWLVRNDPTIEFDEEDVLDKVKQASSTDGDDLIIKQAIKRPEGTSGKRKRIGVSLPKDHNNSSEPVFFEDNFLLPLELSEFEGWGIAVYYNMF